MGPLSEELRRKVEALRTGQALEADPGLAEKIEAHEKAIEAITAGLAAAWRAAEPEPGPVPRPSLKLIRGGLTG